MYVVLQRKVEGQLDDEDGILSLVNAATAEDDKGKAVKDEIDVKMDEAERLTIVNVKHVKIVRSIS